MASIIVADDSYVHRKIIVNVLKEMTDATIIEASNGIDVILCDLKEASLLISDIVMPQMDGMKLIHYIRNIKRIKDLPIIVVSSVISTKEIDKVNSMGVMDIIKKPVNKDTLKEVLGAYL